MRLSTAIFCALAATLIVPLDGDDDDFIVLGFQFSSNWIKIAYCSEIRVSNLGIFLRFMMDVKM